MREQDERGRVELAERRAEEKAEKRKAIETATEMKKDGFAIAKIVKYTGLSIEDIEKL